MSIKNDILSTLAYFDIFQYPLTQTEIILFSSNTHRNADISRMLQILTMERRLYQFDEFYTLQSDPSLVLRRRSGNLKAKQLLGTAEKVAKLLSCFPFVKGIAISGSLSKNYADETSDIDLFIITAKNRLWLARTFLHLLKKGSYLFGKQELFCMNYFVDEAALEIEEKNIYTATEVSTLLPLRGVDAFQDFYKSNNWIRNFLPNHSMRISYVKEIKKSFFKTLVEYCLDNLLGNMADTILMKLTAHRWNKKTVAGKLNSRGVVMSMKAGKHFAKPDPHAFQNKLIEKYEVRLFQVLNADRRILKPVY